MRVPRVNLYWPCREDICVGDTFLEPSEPGFSGVFMVILAPERGYCTYLGGRGIIIGVRNDA